MKTVFITGIGKGIGKALAESFLNAGHTVLGTTKEGSTDYTHEHLQVIQLDLTSPESITNCIATLTQQDVSIDILINNAGVLVDEDETSVVVDKLRQTLEVNLIGTISLTEQLLPLLKEDSHIVTVSSTAGSISLVGNESHHEGYYPSYKISKAAINMYMRTLAMRVHEKTTVSCVHPGWVRTTMGGEEAPTTPEEAADDIMSLALSHPATGHFWHKGEELPW